MHIKVKDEEGQAVVLVALAMSIFLIGAVGLAVDGSHLYSQRQMAQTAADAAAVGGMMSIFNGTNVLGTAAFISTQGTSFTCSSKPSSTPCAYANKDGFALTGDIVTVSFPTDGAAPGVAFAADATHLIQVTVQRSVSTTLLRFLGPTATTVQATAMAAIVSVQSPTPLTITDPVNPDSLTAVGNPTITICGGPSRSVQVNSSSATAYTGGVKIDLSHAGPADPGNCTTGTGAGFGVFGGDPTDAATGNAVNLGSTGQYVSPSSPVQDPFAGVTPPTPPVTIGTKGTITTSGVDGCVTAPCTEYSPGLWSGGLTLGPSPSTVIFKPGVYYVLNGGVNLKNATGGGVGNSAMCVGCTPDPSTGNGLLFYDTGTVSGGFANSSGFNITTGNDVSFVGPTLTTTNSKGQTVPSSPYYNIAMWEDRTAIAQTHSLGQGNGCFTVTGSIYITNTLAIMQAAPAGTHVQRVNYGGNPCSTTATQGDIVVSDLSLNGHQAAITMNLLPYGFLFIRQVALVQ